MDTYNYENMLSKLLPNVIDHCKNVDKSCINSKSVIVLRPDSGDPVETVLMALRYAKNT